MKYPILAYHGISSGNHPYKYRDKEELEFVISAEAFNRQMEIINGENFEVVTLSQLFAVYTNGRTFKKPIVLTFDDGHETNYLNAFPVLRKYSFKAEFFITSDWIGTEGYMTKEQLIEIKNSGMSIQSHAKSHRFLTTLDDYTLEEELADSKKTISEITGQEADFISYPGGRYNARTERFVINAGYKGSLVGEGKFSDLSRPMFGLKRLGLYSHITEKEFKPLINNDFLYHARRWLKKHLLSRFGLDIRLAVLNQ